jgi:imidazolonepropionase-like amidohydrolase
LALKIGVDGLLNLPGNEWDGTGDAQKFELTDDDIKKLAKKKTIVIPSFALTMPIGPKPAIQDFHRKTLKRLANAGAMITMGSNDEQRTIRGEISYWFNLGIFSPEQMIRYMCENAAVAIFPTRKLGKIAEGYEANFLVLNDNPLTNVLKIRLISFAVKSGEKMNLRYD